MKKTISFFLAIVLTMICAFSVAACEWDGWGEWTVVSSPSCTDEGKEVRISKSDPSVFEIRIYAAALGHDYDEWEETAAPACLAGGYQARICKVCGDCDYQPVSALGHDYDEWKITTAPACLTGGYKARICKTCGNYDFQPVSALGHDYGEWVVTTVPTETEDGIETRICKHDNSHVENRTVVWTEGLKYSSVSGGTAYGVGAGTAESNTTILIPAYYNGKPVTEIRNNGFSYCENLTTVIFAANSFIEAIGSSAFVGCENLVSIQLPKNLKSIGQNAFSMCTSLEAITIPASVTTIGPNIFRYCDNLKTIYVDVTRAEAIEKWGESWGDGEYNNGNKIATIVYLDDESEHEWGKWVLTTVPTETADGIETRVCKRDSTHIESRTAYGTAANNLKYTDIRGTAYSVDIGDVKESTTIWIPAYYNGKPVTEIGGSGFALHTYITTVIFAEGSRIEELGSGAFAICESLVDIELPESLKIIGQNAFLLCTSLETITIPASVTTFGPNVFRLCDNLTAIYVKVTREQAIEKWGEGWSDGEYNTGSKIVPIVYLDDAPEHEWGEWVLTTAPTDTEDGIETRVCKHDSTHIESRPFVATEGLNFTTFDGGMSYRVEAVAAESNTTIFIPAYYNGKPVTEIDNNGFAMYTYITTVIFAEGSLIEKLGNGAFYGCENLVNIELPENLKIIGQNAFGMCTSLETITIPASVTTFGSNVFKYCDNLTTIYVDVTKAEAIEKWGEFWGDGEYNTGDKIATIVYLDD